MSASRTRSLLPWVLLALALVGVVLVSGGPGDEGPPLDPRNTGPLGTRGLVLLLEELGAEVDLTSIPGDHDVALLLADRLDGIDRLVLANWVEAGGTLVVTDPGSPLAVPRSDVDFLGGLVDATIGAGTCDVAALAELDRVDPGNGVPYAVGPGDRSCFGDGEDAFVVVSDRSQGNVVSLGGAAVFTNGLLGEQDNAVLAANLLAPASGRRVALIQPPLAGTGEDDLLDLVPEGVKLAVLQLAIAFVVYGLWRTIRLGRPVRDPQPVEIESSEFVSAVGNLLQERRHPRASAEIIAAHATRRLASVAGLGSGAAPETVAASVATRIGRDPDVVAHLLTAMGVATDDDLVDLTNELDRLEQELLNGETDVP